MGCTSSRNDDQPAVLLCRERCNFLDEAIQQRYALAEAHVAYIHSLKGVGLSLQRFFDQDLLPNSMDSPSLVLPPPKQKKVDEGSSGGHSNSGHLQFHSDSDDEEDGSSGSLHHSGNSSPSHPHIEYTHHDSPPSLYPGSPFMKINYMKNKATPSVSYEQRPASPETVRMGGGDSYFPYPYSNQNPSPYPYHNNNTYPNYTGGGAGASNGFFGSSPPLPSYGAATASASSSKPPPPPPSPPKSSAWDFFNPFDTYERHYPAYSPSRNSREVREEEGIPDLEDEDYQHEVVKEVYGHQKFVEASSSYSQAVDNEKGKVIDTDTLYQTRLPGGSVERDPVEYEVHMVEKNVVDNEDKKRRSNVGAFKGGLSEVVREIQAQFERASEAGNELANLLEVGKLSYQRKNALPKAGSKRLHMITPSLSVVASQPSTSTSSESSSSTANDSSNLEVEDAGRRSKNLSSTLRELYLWEKKLYEEVKAEEKMRVIHEKKSRKLKRLDERGAEADKVASTRTLIRSLSTKIRIAIQSIDRISVKINKLRDEDLWPQINELIQGLARMWKAMLECHQSQCLAVREAKSLDAIAIRSHKMLSDSHLKATVQLEHELNNWILSFSYWISAQKGYVRALNNWLLKCLLYEPEETPDGIAPFSPGRIGAPPVFIICNQWSQALDRISGKEVVHSMKVFSRSVLQIWERDKMLMRQSMMSNKDMERVVKNLEREDQKIQREIQSLDKKMAFVSGEDGGQAVYQTDTSSSSNASLHANLKHIFEAMERFTSDSMQAYEELLQRTEEDRLAPKSNQK